MAWISRYSFAYVWLGFEIPPICSDWLILLSFLFFSPDQNKQFIYRGLEYERIGQFTERIQVEFPHAQILTSNAPPNPGLFTENAQYVQISPVRPIPDQPRFKNAMFPVPKEIARFYQSNDVERFQHDRPVHKGQKDRENEFKTYVDYKNYQYFRVVTVNTDTFSESTYILAYGLNVPSLI